MSMCVIVRNLPATKTLPDRWLIISESHAKYYSIGDFHNDADMDIQMAFKHFMREKHNTIIHDECTDWNYGRLPNSKFEWVFVSR
jgi:hypothetical protein